MAPCTFLWHRRKFYVLVIACYLRVFGTTRTTTTVYLPCLCGPPTPNLKLWVNRARENKLVVYLLGSQQIIWLVVDTQLGYGRRLV